MLLTNAADGHAMESGVGRYLHKKFKKQLSIEPRTNSDATEQATEGVPIHSTNDVSSLSVHKSSISNTLVNSDSLVSKRSSSSSSAELENKSVEQSSAIDISYFQVATDGQNEIATTSSISSTSSSFYASLDQETPNKEEQPRTVGNPSGGKYVCTYCNLACSKPSVLQKHIRAHTNERPYPCVSCGFSFKTRSNLYKHCRSRTHANRVMGNKAQEIGEIIDGDSKPETAEVQSDAVTVQEIKTKPYKPRFHPVKAFYDTENADPVPEKQTKSERISLHINELIDKNNSIVNTGDSYLVKRRSSISEGLGEQVVHNRVEVDHKSEEPLNLTKSRKRSLSEVSEQFTQKSLIKELLLKNLYADPNMQCPHCKMIFQTVTELELHKMKSCKGYNKYNRSSSVNVASILIQNKNAFDHIPHMQNVFPLKSPGPFIGNTRLVENDKNKSVSCEDGMQLGNVDILKGASRYSPIGMDKVRKVNMKMSGGQVQITQTSGETKSFKIDREVDAGYIGEVSENRVVKSTLQSGGTVLQNKPETPRNSVNVIRVFEQTPTSPSIDISTLEGRSFTFDRIPHKDLVNGKVPNDANATTTKYTNIMDFSQNAAKLLAPTLKQINLTPGLPKFVETKEPEHRREFAKQDVQANGNITNPLNLYINGKVIRYVPGIPGPVIAETPPEQPPPITQKPRLLKPNIMVTPPPEPKPEERPPPPPPPSSEEQQRRKFARPNSLALKPSMVSLKQHHGLTPTMFNQILISPDTPRGAKKYNEHFLHGNYFSYLGLKSSTKPVYCTLNKTQPFYVPHFKKLSMYSEWRQQDNKSDKLYVSAYELSTRSRRYTIAGKFDADYIAHSSYKFTATEPKTTKEETQKSSSSILGGYESNEDYTYVRGRDESSTRQQEHEAAYGLLSLSQKPSSSINPSLEMVSPSSGTLSISPMSVDVSPTTTVSFINTEQLVHVSKTNYAKNKILDQQKQINFSASRLCNTVTTVPGQTDNRLSTYLGISANNRTLMYPYASTGNEKIEPELPKPKPLEAERPVERKNIAHFNVIKRYNNVQPTSKTKTENVAYADNKPAAPREKTYNPAPQVEYKEHRTSPPNEELAGYGKRKMSCGDETTSPYKVRKSDSEVIDLSMPQSAKKLVNGMTAEVPRRYYEADDERGKTTNLYNHVQYEENYRAQHLSYRSNENVVQQDNNRINVSYIIQESPMITDLANTSKPVDYDNSAMETLADIATKQEKLERNSLAKNVASEFLKLATKNEYPNGEEKTFGGVGKDVNDLVVKSEENKSCTICFKNFSKPSQLRLHMNIHYLERPFRCESCSVSFRTKGHLQKHERSASHHNKLSSSPAMASSEPRPFKCSDCNVAFRIHGHLAKHLRSKMHIMKLECLAKIPFGLYAELERSNSLLTEINTADGDQCLDSLKMLAKKVFINDPSKLNQLDETSDRLDGNS